MENERETIEYKGYNIITFYEDDLFDPRNEHNFGTMACFHGRYSLGDKVEFNSDMFNGWDEMEDYIRKELGAVIVLPLYLYDHSGITIATSPFSCRWDSGQVGFTYATLETLKDEFALKRIGRARLEQAERILEGETKHYDQYLRGNVFGFIVEDSEGNTIDSCGGYIGEDYYDEMVNEAKDNVDSTIQALEKEVTKKVVLG